MTQLTMQYGEEPVQNDMKMDDRTSIQPAVIQDFMYQHVVRKTKYADISDKVVVWVGNRVAITTGPIPMDTGGMGQRRQQHAGGGDGDRHGGECVDDVPPLRTRPFVTRLRIARQGQGEGRQRRTERLRQGHQYQQQHEGEEKGGTKGGKGSKGGGKGYEGTSWRCGQVGHKAAECTKHVHVVSEASPREVEEVGVGGVWMVGGVDGDWKTPKKPTIKMSEAAAKGNSQTDSNRFRVLDDRDDHDDDSEEEVFIGVVENTKRHECVGPDLSKTKCDEVPCCEGAEATGVGSKVREGAVSAWDPKKRTTISRTSILANGCKYALEEALTCLTYTLRTGSVEPSRWILGLA